MASGEDLVRVGADARLSQLRKYRRALVGAIGDWRKENATTRKCAGEFCDLVEPLP
jgi:hypothetical protein